MPYRFILYTKEQGRGLSLHILRTTPPFLVGWLAFAAGATSLGGGPVRPFHAGRAKCEYRAILSSHNAGTVTSFFQPRLRGEGLVNLAGLTGMKRFRFGGKVLD